VPFANFASIADLARAYGITLADEAFVSPLERPERAVPEILRTELAFAERHVAFDNSEFAVCENLIYPVLKEVWKTYLADLMLWNHELLYCDAELSGTPDYFISRRSPLGRWVVEVPYLLIVEAKKDDFARGWAQCLAAMLAAQKLNKVPELTLQGITTNGQFWEFGKLAGSTFTRDLRPFSLRNLEELWGVLHSVFEQCRVQVVRLPRSA